MKFHMFKKGLCTRFPKLSIDCDSIGVLCLQGLNYLLISSNRSTDFLVMS